MSLGQKKSPTIAGSSSSESIHLQLANDPYFNMIVGNEECAAFCSEMLSHFESLVNEYLAHDAVIEREQRLNLYLALVEIDKRGRS